MKRYRTIGLAAGLVIVAAVLLIVWGAPREPVYQGRPISEWIDQLTGVFGDFSGAVASPMLPKLIQQEPGLEIVPYLRATLHRGTSFLHRRCAALYGRLPPGVANRLPRPNPARDAQLRYRAALILYYLGPRAKPAVPDLTAALRDGETEVRRVAAAALGNIGPEAKAAAPALRISLADRTPGVRRAAMKALSSIETDPGVIVPTLALMLKDADEGVRMDAAEALKDFGTRARLAVHALTRALEDPNADVFRFAAMALGKIGPEAREAVPALQRALREPRPYTETTLRWALRQIDPNAELGGVAK